MFRAPQHRSFSHPHAMIAHALPAPPRSTRARRARPHVARLLALVAALGCAHRLAPRGPDAPPQPALEGLPQESNTAALLQAVSVVDEKTVWVAGHSGTFVRTTDGGATWHSAVVPGAERLEFRDVAALSADTAYLLAAGPGELSRIYKTTDAGRSWTLQFTNHQQQAFFDCLDFWDADHGIAVSDAVGGHFLILTTADGGATWSPVPASALPDALPGEGGFAASGTCVVARAPGDAWIGTGNTSAARVLHTSDRGRTWTSASTPVLAGDAAGIASVAFRDAKHGVVLGGPIGKPDARTDNVAITADGGRTWRLGGRPSFSGAVYGSAYVPRAATPTLVAVGPKGAALSRDDGRTWTQVDTLAYWAVGFASPSAGWAVGPNGRITKLVPR
jgi:photosystem II stability/assembly factor-like uncharacterized protein